MAQTPEQVVLVRDSRDPVGPVPTVDTAGWCTFLATLPYRVG